MAPSLGHVETHNGANVYANTHPRRIPSRFFSEPPSLGAFQKICSQTASSSTYPLSSTISKNIPIYNLSSLRNTHVSHLQDEWYHILLSGPGVLVLKGMFTNQDIINATNNAFSQIISSERIISGAKGDHFGAAGQNTRIWNSLQKHCIESPESFVEYYSNPWIHAIAEAWLGPSYRVTAQANIVHPGGKAQTSHRDYHLGFQSTEATARFPREMQIASQLLTLQGAVAHSDMPATSGPTRFLPFSQGFQEGFLAYRRGEFQQYFNEHWVSLELEVGDAVFFNPALFHAAGENQTKDLDRWANLLQISSAFGKTMESLDTKAMAEACWDEMQKLYEAEGWSERLQNVVKTVAEGYPFPTNLDRRVPGLGGMAPESEQDLLEHGLREHWNKARVLQEIRSLNTDAAA
ncbi:MAG: hypothetical protein M1820_009216 [Bogoriella megaspora]|nr:MAG: hypothetical protein M1820_009216 [Bogoriella megaspora]